MISIDYDNDKWVRDESERNMILIGTLFNAKILDVKIMSSIINDFKMKILFKDDELPEYYEKVEKSIQLLAYLISSIIINEDSKKVYNNIDYFLEAEMNKYEEKKNISKKIRLTCKNTIVELRKNI